MQDWGMCCRQMPWKGCCFAVIVSSTFCRALLTILVAASRRYNLQIEAIKVIWFIRCLPKLLTIGTLTAGAKEALRGCSLPRYLVGLISALSSRRGVWGKAPAVFLGFQSQNRPLVHAKCWCYFDTNIDFHGYLLLMSYPKRCTKHLAAFDESARGTGKVKTAFSMLLNEKLVQLVVTVTPKRRDREKLSCISRK